MVCSRIQSRPRSERAIEAVDPEIIILGRLVSRSYELFREAVRGSMRDFAYSMIPRNIKIEVSEREHIAILGATALCYDAKE